MSVILLGDDRYPGTAPNLISGCQLWLQADSGVYEDAGTDPAEDLDAVVQWNDGSGNGRHFGIGNSPAYRTAIVNGQPVLRYDGTNDFMQKTGQTFTNYTAIGAATIMMAVNLSSAPGGEMNLFAMYESGVPRYVRRLFANGTNFVAENYDGTVDTATKSVGAGWKILTYRHNGTNLYIGDTDTRDSSLASAASSTTSVGGAVDLYVRNIPVAAVQTDIFGLAVYNVDLTEANRKEIEQYWANLLDIALPY